MLKWVKDHKVEHHLRQLGIKFVIATIKIADIDRQLSADKQVRLGKKLNEDWILQYAEAMQNGAAFPMPIVNKLKSGKKYFLWSGNHRVGSADVLGEDSVDCYVVEVYDARLSDIIPRVVNAWEAQGVMAKDEKLVHAKYLVEHHSMEPKDAAKLMGLKWDWLNAHLRSQQIADKMSAAGVNPDGFAKATLLKLSPIADNVNVLAHVTKLISKERPTIREQEQIIADIKQGKTELQQLSEIGRWEKIYKDRRQVPKVRVPYKQPVRELLLSLLQRLDKLTNDKNDKSQLQIIEETDYMLAKRHYSNIVKNLGQVFN